MSSVGGDVGAVPDALPPGSVPAPPKPRLPPSPLDYRNGDLVSRLLAATPPYLYNMPLVPHSFFFSEMLRSFVQAKAEAGGSPGNGPGPGPGGGPGAGLPPGAVPPPVPPPPHAHRGHGTVGGHLPPHIPPHVPTHRRSRKRAWREMSADRAAVAASAAALLCKQPTPPVPPLGLPAPPIVPGPPPMLDKPLELTTTSRQERSASSGPRPPSSGSSTPADEKLPPPSASPGVGPIGAIPPPPLLLPPCGLLPGADGSGPGLPPDLLLPPPPPPLWYPPLYPLPPQPPYGIDPLHFFIDLRVSGHIWDRKLGKENSGDGPGSGMPALDDKATLGLPGPGSRPPSAGSSGASALVKHTKHCSAFSVPQPRGVGCEGRNERIFGPARGPTSTHYVLQNLARIYQDVRPSGVTPSGGGSTAASVSGDDRPASAGSSAAAGSGAEDANAEPGDAGKPRCKDLRALIGLELVVDYVKHEGGPRRRARPSTPATPATPASAPSPAASAASAASPPPDDKAPLALLAPLHAPATEGGEVEGAGAAAAAAAAVAAEMGAQLL